MEQKRSLNFMTVYNEQKILANWENMKSALDIMYNS